MKRARFLSVSAVAVAMLFAVSCGEPGPLAPTSSTTTPQTDLVGTLLQGTGLLSCSALPYDSVTQAIGPAGGTLQVGPHVLVVPPGALSSSVSITAVAPSGNVRLVKFRPEGLQFARSAALTMSYANCSLLATLLPKRIAYTNDALQILEYLLSLDNVFAKKVTGQVNHFSGYAVAY